MAFSSVPSVFGIGRKGAVSSICSTATSRFVTVSTVVTVNWLSAPRLAGSSSSTTVFESGATVTCLSNVVTSSPAPVRQNLIL